MSRIKSALSLAVVSLIGGTGVAAAQGNLSSAPPISSINRLLMGTGTEWDLWNIPINQNGVSSSPYVYTVLQNSLVPTHSEKFWLGDETDMTHAQDLLNAGESPIMLEGNDLQAAYVKEYGQSGTGNSSIVWDSNIQASMNNYLNTVMATRISNMQALASHGHSIYYVLNPEFTIVGDAKTSSGYGQWLQTEISALRAANIPNLKIVLGFLISPSDFQSYLPTIQAFAQAHPNLLGSVDYFGPAFHNQLQVNSTVAANIVSFLESVYSYTKIPTMIPYSYIYWDIYYNGSDTTHQQCGSESDAAAFWNYLQAHRDTLVNNAHLWAWTLSNSGATQTGSAESLHGGSGLLSPLVEPVNYSGYPYPFAGNQSYNQGGLAYINWMRAESPYTFTNRDSGNVMDVPSASSGTQLVQHSWQSITSQLWVLVGTSSGYYQLQDKYSGLYAAVQNGSSSDGTPIVEVTDPTQTSAQWSLIDEGNGYYEIKNRATGGMLSGNPGHNTAGQSLVQESDTGSTVEQWSLNYKLVY